MDDDVPSLFGQEIKKSFANGPARWQVHPPVGFRRKQTLPAPLWQSGINPAPILTM